MTGGHPISNLHPAQFDRNGEFRRRDPDLVRRNGKALQETAESAGQRTRSIARRQTLLPHR